MKLDKIEADTKAYSVYKIFQQLTDESSEPLYLFQLTEKKWTNFGELKRLKKINGNEVQIIAEDKKVSLIVSQSQWFKAPFYSNDKMKIKDIRNIETYVIGTE